jgi:toxin-antitoxin system PIN domain toxin
MILVDANLLLYAVMQDSPRHEAARGWLEECLNGTARVGLPWESLLAFCRLTTNPRVFGRPLTIETAWRLVRAWLEVPVVWIPQPTERHAEEIGRLLLAVHATGNLVPDAHLAALAIENGLELCSTDWDFARFPGLRWRNPLADRP